MSKKASKKANRGANSDMVLPFLRQRHHLEQCYGCNVYSKLREGYCPECWEEWVCQQPQPAPPPAPVPSPAPPPPAAGPARGQRGPSLSFLLITVVVALLLGHKALQVLTPSAYEAAQATQADGHSKSPKASEVLLVEPATPTEAPVPHNAQDCKTMDDLKAWLKARSDTVKKYVPKDYQTFAMKSIVSDYESNKKRIEDDKKAPSKPVKGPLMLAEEDDKVEDKDKVAEAEKKADSWVDEASQGMKDAFNKAAAAVEGKADNSADKGEFELSNRDKRRAAKKALKARAFEPGAPSKV